MIPYIPHITITKLRMGIQYEQTCSQPMDSFYELYEQWMVSRPELNFHGYNFTFDGSKPVRNKEVIKLADYIIIPSESEWRFHCPELWQEQYESHANVSTNYRYPWPVKLPYKDYLDKTNKAIEEVKPYLENKTIILWRNERADDEELYRTKTLKVVNLKSFHIIDECDFSGNINGMKYHNIPTLNKDLYESGDLDRTKKVDFAYWGASWKDDRDQVIYDLYDRKDISTTLVGGFLHLPETDDNHIFPWARDWRDLLPIVKSSRSTICFNWKDETATTSRYIESLACGIIPFVWCGDGFIYDKNNTYNIDDWQRISSVDEFVDKNNELRDADFLKFKLREYRKNYKKVLISKREYAEEFNNRMNEYVRS